MPIVQISRIQHRRGKRTDLPQLAAGELGWVINEQKLFIGNGTVSDGAPAVGNTEIMTAGTSAFTTALSHTYKGYLGDSTPIVTGASGDVTRTLQQRLDDYASVKDFGAAGDDSTADLTAIQRAIDELYRDTDKDDTRARRTLFFPAGIYRINGSIKVPPYANLVGEGPDKTIIRNSGNNAVLVMQDDEGNVGADIGNSGATAPQQIQVSNMTLRNTVAYGGVSLDRITNSYFNNVKFQGSFASGGSDATNSKGVTVTNSTSTYTTKNIVFNQCQFTKFARLVDISFNSTNIRFNACDFSTAYYGALLGAEMDGSTTGLDKGPRDIQFTSSAWSDIGQQAILVAPASGTTDSAGPRHIVSHANWYAETVGNNFDGVNSINEVPVIQFDNDECTSTLDFFERTSQRDTDFGDSTDPSNTPPEVQGIGLHTKAVKQITLSDNTSTATDTGIYLPGFFDKGVRITYKMNRGAKYRTGVFTISAAGELCTHNDDYEETADVGTVLSAKTSDGDSTAGNDTIRVQYTTTSDSSTDVTMEYQVQILV